MHLSTDLSLHLNLYFNPLNFFDVAVLTLSYAKDEPILISKHLKNKSNIISNFYISKQTIF